MKRKNKNKLGQVWVETMVYTLIAFSLLGLVLAFVKPEIEKAQDRIVIEQSIGILQDLDSTISSLGGPGNQRVLSLVIKKGTLVIDGGNNTIFFQIDSSYEYSQPGEILSVGSIKATTIKKSGGDEVTLLSNLSSVYNITVAGLDQQKEINKAQTPYTLKVSEKGIDTGGKIIIDINVS